MSLEEERKRSELVRHLRAAIEELRPCVSLFDFKSEPELKELLYLSGGMIQEAIKKAEAYVS